MLFFFIFSHVIDIILMLLSLSSIKYKKESPKLNKNMIDIRSARKLLRLRMNNMQTRTHTSSSKKHCTPLINDTCVHSRENVSSFFFVFGFFPIFVIRYKKFYRNANIVRTMFLKRNLKYIFVKKMHKSTQKYGFWTPF